MRWVVVMSDHVCYLTPLQVFALHQSVDIIRNGLGGPADFSEVFLVGSCLHKRDFRDVDVRAILDNKTYDHMFKRDCDGNLWTLMCVSIGTMLSVQTGLSIDFQIQRFDEANARYGSLCPRLPLGYVSAYGGDRTPVTNT